MLLDGHGGRGPTVARSSPGSTGAPAPDPASRTIRIEAIVTDKHGAPITNLRTETSPPRQRRGAETRRRRMALERAARRRSGRAPERDQGRPRRSARREGAGHPPHRALSRRVPRERRREHRARSARRVPLHRRAGAPERSARGDEAARPPNRHPLHARSRQRAAGRRAASADGATTTRRARRSRSSISADRRCGARRARADCDVRTCARWRPEWATSTAVSGASCW